MATRKPLRGTQVDTGQSTMRRLSSIASLHQLLPFSRSRRSDGASDSLISSSPTSNSVFTSSISTVQSLIQASNDATDTERAQAHARVVSDRGRGQTSIPRSRTFSNLPLPMRSKHKTRSGQSKLESSQESSSICVPTSTRVPTPTGSTRRYLPFGYRNDGKARLQRSDTEPLLSSVVEQQGNLHRSTTFKENLAPSAIHSPPLLVFEAEHGSLGNASRQTPLPRDKSFCNVVPATPTRSWSKPVIDPTEDKTPTQTSYLAATAPVARYRNALADISNVGRATREQPRLGTKNAESEKTCDITTSESAAYYATAPTVSSHVPSPRVVLEAQPPAYWSGRLSSTLDRQNNRGLAANTTSKDSFGLRSETDKLYGSEACSKRARQALEELFATCATNEARESFVRFQLQYAALQNDAELAKPIGSFSARSKAYLTGSGKSVRTLHGDIALRPVRSDRKPSFVDRLLGRSKRNSLT